jgi:hypothetical protein
LWSVPTIFYFYFKIIERPGHPSDTTIRSN